MFIPKHKRDKVGALITQDGQALEIVPGSLVFEEAEEYGEYWFSAYHCEPLVDEKPSGFIVTLESGNVIGYTTPKE
jgi:hypothetical protein